MKHPQHRFRICSGIAAAIRIALATTMTGAVPAAYAQTAPIRANDFVSSVGVNIHSTYFNTIYANTGRTIDSLHYVGLNHVRDADPATTDPGFLDIYERYMRAGMVFDMVVFARTGSIAPDMATLDYFIGKYPQGVFAIEGPNEPGSDYSYQGQTGTAAATAVLQQIDIAKAGDPLLATSNVVMFALGSWSQFGTLDNLSPYVAFGNAHIYYQCQAPSLVIPWALPTEAQSTPNSPMDVTETGYASQPGIDPPSGSVNVNEDVQQKYTLDAIFDYKLSGVRETYLYELFDEMPNAQFNNYQNHIGLFRSDYSAKPVAIALHNLTKIFADTGRNSRLFRPKPLAMTIAGMPQTNQVLVNGIYYTNIGGQSYTIAKSNGSYDIVVWAEPALWNITSNQEMPTAGQAVTLSFPRSYASVALFDPTQSSHALNTIARARQITVPVSDHPIIVEVRP